MRGLSCCTRRSVRSQDTARRIGRQNVCKLCFRLVSFRLMLRAHFLVGLSVARGSAGTSSHSAGLIVGRATEALCILLSGLSQPEAVKLGRRGRVAQQGADGACVM